MTATNKPMADRNVAIFTLSRKDAAELIRDLAWALAKTDEIEMELRTNRIFAGGEFHEIHLGLRGHIGGANGTITESAAWDE